MKRYADNRAQKGKVAFRTPRSFVAKRIGKPQRIERFWGLAKRLEHIRKERRK